METVIVDKPFFGGAGGVREQTQMPGVGWYWFSAEGWSYPTTPFKIDEVLEHLPTADNNFINYSSYFTLEWYDPAYNVKHFGADYWYSHNLKEPYRTIVRDVSKQYNMTAIMTDPKVLAEIEDKISQQFEAHIKSTGLHVHLRKLSMGKVLPNASVVAEMDNTAVQQQRKKSEVQRKLAEDSRFDAETSRAKADNAYRNAMGLNPQEFVSLELGKKYSEACGGGHCTVIVSGGAVPVVLGAGK